MTPDDFRDFLRAKAADAGSKKALAAQFGISAAYMGDVLNGRKSPGPAILGRFNLHRVIRYEPIRAPRADRGGE